LPSNISSELVAHLIESERVAAINVLGPTIQFLTSLEETSAPCIMRGTIPPAASIPLHSHAAPETFMLISGAVEGLVVSGDDFRWVAVDPGRIFHGPPNAKHAWRNRGHVPAVMPVISTSRMGRFFQELGKRAAGGAPAAPRHRERSSIS
jgi:quercetin dioxygenase-like cupin family protein